MLVGFLTGVGIQVAVAQLPDMLGVEAASEQTLGKLVNTVRALPHVRWADVATSIAVIALVVVVRWLNPRVPGLLIAVVAAIGVSWAADLAGHGVTVVGPVPRGPPRLGRPGQARPGTRTEEGLVVYRFGTSLYYANASRLVEDIAALVGHGSPLRWMVIDCAAIGDVDYTASAVLAKVIEHVHQHHVHLALSCVLGPVRQRLDRYGISKALGQDAYFDTPGAALEAFRSTVP